MKATSLFFSVLIGSALLGGSSSCKSSDKSGAEESATMTKNDSAIAPKVKKDTLLIIKGTNVNLRVSPDLEAVRIRQLTTNDTCVILEKGKQDTINESIDFWYKIQFKNKEGWVFGTFTSLKVPEKPAVNKNKTWIK